MTGLIFHLIPHTATSRAWNASRPGVPELPAGRADRAARGLRGRAARARDRHQGAGQDGAPPGWAMVCPARRADSVGRRAGAEPAPGRGGRGAVGRATRRAVFARRLRPSRRVAHAGAGIRDPLRRRVARLGGGVRAGARSVPLARTRRKGGAAVASATHGVRGRGDALDRGRAGVPDLGAGARRPRGARRRKTHSRLHRRRSPRRAPRGVAPARSPGGARSPECVPGVASRRVLPSGRRWGQAGVARGGAAVVVPVRVDAPGRACDAGAAQAPLRRGRAGADAVGRAARGAGAPGGRSRPAAAAGARLARVGALSVSR